MNSNSTVAPTHSLRVGSAEPTFTGERVPMKELSDIFDKVALMELLKEYRGRSAELCNKEKLTKTENTKLKEITYKIDKIEKMLYTKYDTPAYGLNYIV
jgi:hypothetical protein